LIKQFTIKKICAEENRPPYSSAIDRYFEAFVHDNILKPYNIIVNEDWKVILSIMIFKKDDDSPEGVCFYEPDIFEDDKLKIYPVAINLEDIYKNEEHVINIVGLYFQIISLFFLSNYNIVSREYLAEQMQKLDWNYLLSIPYPATKEDQGYVDTTT
jgi:hypothetical protein